MGRSGARLRWTAWVLLAFGVAAVCGLASCGGRKRPWPAGDRGGVPAVPSPPADRPTTGPSRSQAPLLIRAGLTVGAPEVRVGTGTACVLREGTGRRQIARWSGPATLSVQRAGPGLHWEAGDASGTASSLVVQPTDPVDVLRWHDQPYPGEFLLIPAAAAGVTLINIVELESYLSGVVPWEIGRTGRATLAAQEAQAVAARTYTLSHLAERASLGFDVWADVQDQVYRGADGQDEICNEAIARTAGMVLQYAGREIDAYYCSTCGGWTSNIEEVWPRPAQPYLRSHADTIASAAPFCADAPHFAWEVTWDALDLQHILAETLPQYLDYLTPGTRADWAGEAFSPRQRGADPRVPGRLWDLSITRRTSSGRVGCLDVVTDAGVYHVRGDRVRWALRPPAGDPAILWSALFALEIEVDQAGRPSRITARGHGFGHGVGLCQMGALEMARRGYSCRQILAHYYPGSRLTPYARPAAR